MLGETLNFATINQEPPSDTAIREAPSLSTFDPSSFDELNIGVARLDLGQNFELNLGGSNSDYTSSFGKRSLVDETVSGWNGLSKLKPMDTIKQHREYFWRAPNIIQRILEKLLAFPSLQMRKACYQSQMTHFCVFMILCRKSKSEVSKFQISRFQAWP